MRKIKSAVIHCSDFNGQHTAHDIKQWHLKRGFTTIGYHFVIGYDGVVEEGRELSKIGAHAFGFNSDSIGICLLGKGPFFKLQLDSLKNLLIDLRKNHPTLATIHMHAEFSYEKNCPNMPMDQWLDVTRHFYLSED